MKRVYQIILLITAIYCKKPSVANLPIEHRFFAVTAKDGLNLRAEPNNLSKKITTLPYMFRGKILRQDTKPMKIQGANGFWLETEYKGFRGWVFSGFVWFLRTEQEVLNFVIDEKTEYSVVRPPELAALPDTLEIATNNYTLIDRPNAPFSFFLAKGPNAGLCTGRQLVAKNKVSGRFFETNIDDTEFRDITPKDLSAEIFMFESIGLSCSCGAHTNTEIIFLNSSPSSISLDALNLKAWESQCDSGEGWTPSHTQARYSLETRILYVFIKAPICSRGNGGVESRSLFTGRHSGKFMTFARKGSETIISESLDATEIPERHREAWASARPL